MTRIDRYLLFLYFRVLTICFSSLSGLLVVVLLFTNLDEFQSFAKQSEKALMQVVAEYYGPHLLTFFERLSGLLALLALLFVIAWLNKTNEFTAMLAAGIPRKRIVRPLMLASAFVIISAVLVREYAVPRYQDQLDRLPQDLTGELPRRMQPTFVKNAQALLEGRHLLPAHFQIVSPILRAQSSLLSDSIGMRLTAENAFFRAAENGKPQGYLFCQVDAGKGIDQMESVYATDGKPILLTPKDVNWLAADECFLVCDTEFEMLRGGSSWRQYASAAELIDRLQHETKSGNDLRVSIHSRFLRPVIDWTVVLLGLPILLTRPDRHMFWVAGACLILVAGFSGIVIALNAIGTNGSYISPLLAVWLPVLVVLPWAWGKSAIAMES